MCLQLVAVCVIWLGPCGSNHSFDLISLTSQRISQQVCLVLPRSKDLAYMRVAYMRAMLTSSLLGRPRVPGVCRRRRFDDHTSFHL